MNRPNAPHGAGDMITILLVDDIAETRESVKKLLAFEPDFKVIGSVGSGHDGIAMAKELKPNIIIMDINMPDMDGIQATAAITQAVPTAAVIMMSVNTDLDYMRRAMLAGARNFLSKPVDPDELYNTIRSVYNEHKRIADKYREIEQNPLIAAQLQAASQRGAEGAGNRAGNIIVVYSPQGGAGCTTIATNLASGLMKENVRVLLVDADLQFGDVGVFLNLQSQTNVTDLLADADTIDIELFESVLATHDSGLKVLLGPSRPEHAEEVQARSGAISQILQKITNHYDYIVIDTARHMDELLLSLLDLATKIILVGTPTLASVKNIRFVLDLFDRLDYGQDKIMLVLNRMHDERQKSGRVTIPSEIIEKHLKRHVEAKIPVAETVVLSAVNKGVPVIASDKDKSKSPIKELIELAEHVNTVLMPASEEAAPAEDKRSRSGTGIRLPFGR
ncbi:MAG: response regulator [Burkholderiales bacterium]|nr:response regulator [Anaerolineae bacterium]